MHTFLSRLPKLVFGGIVFAIILTPLFYLPDAIFPYTLPKVALFQLLIGITTGLWLVLIVFRAEYRPTRHPLFIALGVFLFFLLATSFLGEDFSRSLWSTQGRATGIVSLLHFSVFAVMISSPGRDPRHFRIFLWATCITSLLVSVIAFFQFQDPNFLISGESIGDDRRPGGTFGNPTFLAGYLLFHLFFVPYLWFTSSLSGRSARVLGFSLGAIFLIDLGALILTQTRGNYLGLLAGGLVVFLLFSLRPPRTRTLLFADRRFYAAVLLVTILFGGSFWATRSAPFWQSIPGLKRFAEIDLSGNLLLPRLTALQTGWQGFLDKPLKGWGWENFNLAYNAHYDPKALEVSYRETRFDKPHNIFLEYLVSGGIFLFLSYLLLLGVFMRSLWRSSDEWWGVLGIGALVAYIIQNIFVFDTLGTWLMFFLLLGLTISRSETSASLLGTIDEKSPLRRFAAILFLLSGVLWGVMHNGPIFQAAQSQYAGSRFIAGGRIEEGVKSFTRSLTLETPYSSDFAKDFAASVITAHFYNPGLVPHDTVRMVLGHMERVVREHPYDALHYSALADMYTQASDVDEAYLSLAIDRAKEALLYSPDRQEAYFAWAKAEFLRGDLEAALTILKDTIVLAPEVPDSHFYYGIILSQAGDFEGAYQALKKAIILGKTWKNYYEPREVANIFANAAQFVEAIDLYLITLKMNPSDDETRLKLGVAYFFAGERALARKTLTEVLERVDLKTKPSYPQFRPILQELGILPI